jgi:serine/threonine protein kinase
VIFPERYEPTGLSSGGGMGDIIQCIDKHLGRHVIFKLLKHGEDERRLIDEQKALIQVRSKHVVQLFDVTTVQTKHGPKSALVLENIDGTELVLNDYYPDEKYLKIVWQIACGLNEIHAAKIIHRDIKANNILIDADGVVKILDFGLARTHGLGAETLSVIGTPGYMAPELWKVEETISFDHAVDTYAFGVTALALISSSLPPELSSRPPQPVNPSSVRAILAGLPDDVIAILIQCLNYTPSDRPLMSTVEETFRRHLLNGQHRALLVMNGNTHEINKASPGANITCGALGSIQIRYDGTSFKVTSISGNILVNNNAITTGYLLPACCVITFASGSSRKFMTFDVSNPEVTA